MPQRAQGRRGLGRAEARRRGRVRRVDARRPPARAVVQGAARGQGRPRRCTRRSRCRRSPQGQARTLKLSNLDKVFFPSEGITKGDLLAYYREVAPVLVPHLKDRPFTMHRYPDGIDGKHFFQKDAPVAHAGLDPDVPHARLDAGAPRQAEAAIDFPLVNDELALLWMVNMGCIDLNAWYSRVDKPERPDFVLFDLDPSAGRRDSPRSCRSRCSSRRRSTRSGSSASRRLERPTACTCSSRRAPLHLRGHAPVLRDRRRGDRARRTAGSSTTEWTKSKRRGVLIDSNQNGEGKTIASVYSVRPRRGAPVSTPLRWEEVNEELDPTRFTMDVVRRRIEEHGDLFEGVLKTRQRLTAALRLDGQRELGLLARGAPARAPRRSARRTDAPPLRAAARARARATTRRGRRAARSARRTRRRCRGSVSRGRAGRRRRRTGSRSRRAARGGRARAGARRPGTPSCARSSSPHSEWRLTISYSSSVSAPGLFRISSGTESLPMSCRRPPAASTRRRSRR